MKIPITKLTVGQEEAEAVRKVLESGWLIQGPKVAEFEKLLRSYVGAEYAVACSSCTTALHMGLVALGIQRLDTVVVPAFTFVATPNAAEYIGANPLFVDIDLRTFNIDCTNAEAKVARSLAKAVIKAVIPVHLFGMCADMDTVRVWAKDRNLRVLEDAACALGSRYVGKLVGGFAGRLSPAGCYSFHPRKSLTTAEGGMLVTNNPEIAAKVHALRDFGFETTNVERHKAGSSTMPEVGMLGYNYRLDDVRASIGVEQFKKFPDTVLERQRRAAQYDRELAGIPWLRTPYVDPQCNHTYQSYVTLVWPDDYHKPRDAEEIDKWEEVRNRFVAHLTAKEIFTRQGTQAVHALAYYRKKYHIDDPMSCPNAWAAARLSVTLPLYPQMTIEEQDYVLSAIKEFKA